MTVLYDSVIFLEKYVRLEFTKKGSRFVALKNIKRWQFISCSEVRKHVRLDAFRLNETMSTRLWHYRDDIKSC